MRSQNAETTPPHGPDTASLESFPPELIAQAAKLVREQMDLEERRKKIAAEGLASEADSGLYEVEDAGWNGFLYAKHLHPKPDLCGHYGLPGELQNPSMRNVYDNNERALRLRAGDVIRVGEGCVRPSSLSLRRLAPAEEIAAVPVEDAAVITDALARLAIADGAVAAASARISERKQRIAELQNEILEIEAQRENLMTGVSARREELTSLFPNRSKEWKEQARKIAVELPGLLIAGEEWHERYHRRRR